MIGKSNGAISIINAIPCGIGATMGISLQTRAQFTEAESTRIEIIDGKGIDDRLVRLCVKRTLDAIGVSTGIPYKLVVKSQIPPSRGLKSSSSVCNAVINAVLNAFDETMDECDMLRIGVECSKEAGVSITGAFDDACGCHFGGLVFTDNVKNIILERQEIPEYEVVLWIPDRTLPKNKVPREAYTARKEEFSEALALAYKDPLAAMTMNGRLVAEIVGSGMDIIDLALDNGALAAGVSGTGPAIAIVTELAQGKRIADIIGGDTRITWTR